MPAGMKLIGASTDRADFHRQAAISASKAEGNAVGPRFRLCDFEGFEALRLARQSVRPPCVTALALPLARLASLLRCPGPFSTLQEPLSGKPRWGRIRHRGSLGAIEGQRPLKPEPPVARKAGGWKGRTVAGPHHRRLFQPLC